jgi:hypothetical protein
VLEFRCAELRGCVNEKTMPKPLTAFETMPLDLDIDPELKGTRPCGKAGLSILERLADIQSLTVQIQEKTFFAAMFTDDRLDIGKPPPNDFLQLRLSEPIEPLSRHPQHNSKAEKLASGLPGVRFPWSHEPPTALHSAVADAQVALGTLRDVSLLSCLPRALNLLSANGSPFPAIPPSTTIPKKIEIPMQ